jgi:hypothetical protein
MGGSRLRRTASAAFAPAGGCCHRRCPPLDTVSNLWSLLARNVALIAPDRPQPWIWEVGVTTTQALPYGSDHNPGPTPGGRPGRQGNRADDNPDSPPAHRADARKHEPGDQCSRGSEP